MQKAGKKPQSVKVGIYRKYEMKKIRNCQQPRNGYKNGARKVVKPKNQCPEC